MLREGARAGRGLRWSALGLAVLLAATAVTVDSAAARSKRRHHTRHHAKHHAVRYNPPYASIVVDANSGKVLEATNADSLRHPASLSKLMTLYLLFERLASGKIALDTPLTVSRHAAAQAPSKLGLRPGQTISAEDAIKAIVTKSANDAAVVVAENLASGSETEFGRMMTAKAHALGMSRTNYHNASGLPDDKQITTARDQAILARALQDKFPQYFHFFSLRTFVWHGRKMRNHNHLLGQVPGLDGMKTGYIRDSGFNIVTDVKRGGRHIIAVVFGGRTARARDAKVRNLIEDEIKVASVTRTAPKVVEGWKAKQMLSSLPRPAADPRDQIADVVSTITEPPPGSTAPIQPIKVKTVSVEPGAAHASVSPLPLNSGKAARPATSVQALKHTNTPLPDKRPPETGIPTRVASAGADEATVSQEAAAKAHRGYMIQVGAFDDKKEAEKRLVTAQSKAKSVLIKADPFTERVDKGSKSLYRARFAGLDKRQAESACRHLKRSDIPCLMLRN
ncbi:MAG TPA: serine hydrolase [Pseudolabrys sp.]|jgi:D-alanyl-D-alanine carboxypeptidase|nr:serine hydrolase [Pseudolabrys sp.]